MNKNYFRQSMRECRLSYLEQIGLKEGDLVRDDGGKLYFTFEGTRIDLPKEFYLVSYFMARVLKGTQFNAKSY